MSSAVNDGKLYREVKRFFFTWLKNYLIANPVKGKEVLKLITKKIHNLNQGFGMIL